MLMSYQMWRALARKRPLILIALIFLLEIAVYLVLTRPLETLVGPLAGYARVVGVLAP
jgi:type II secretory pathway component PulM